MTDTPMTNLPELLKAATPDRTWLIDLQTRLETLRQSTDDYVIVSLGVRGPNVDCRNGNAVATVRMGDDSETYEALYLPDAISGARNTILRKRQAEAARREREKATTLAKLGDL